MLPSSGPSRRLAIGPSQDVASGPLRTAGALLLFQQDEDLDLETDNDENSDVDSNDEKEANHIPNVKGEQFLLLDIPSPRSMWRFPENQKRAAHGPRLTTRLTMRWESGPWRSWIGGVLTVVGTAAVNGCYLTPSRATM